MGGGQDFYHGMPDDPPACTCEWDESPGDNYGQGGEPYITKKDPACPVHAARKEKP